MKKRSLLLLPFLIFGMSLGGCNPASEGPSTILVEKVTLDKSSAEIEVGDTLQLVPTLTPDNATDKKVTWNSSRSSIATVNNGLVTGVAAGTTVISATAGKGRAECSVTVKEKGSPVTPTLDSINVSNAKADYYVGDELDRSQLTVIARYSDNSTKPVTDYTVTGFDSSAAVNGQVVTVTYQGKTATFSVNILEKAGPVVEEHTYGIIGLHGWGDADEDAMTVADGVASITVTVAVNNEFKVREDKSWTDGKWWGANDVVSAPEGSYEAGDSSNIKMKGAGELTISFNLETKKITLTGDLEIPGGEQQEEHTYGVLGVINGVEGWDNEHEVAMTVNEGVASIAINVIVGDKIKVREDHSWTAGKFWGANDVVAAPEGSYEADGDGNIVLKGAGELTVSLNLETKKITLAGDLEIPGGQQEEEHTYGVIGLNGWGDADEVAMTVNEGVASVTVTVAVGNEFKVREDKSWTDGKWWGANDVVAAPEGSYEAGDSSNIKMKGAGELTISFNLSTKKITLSGELEIPAAPVEHTYGVVGVIGGVEDWGAANAKAMTVNEGVASITLTVQVGDKFKIVQDNAWTNFWGAEKVIAAPAGSYEADGDGNILMKGAGELTISFNIAQLQITLSGELEIPTPKVVVNAYIPLSSDWFNNSNPFFVARVDDGTKIEYYQATYVEFTEDDKAHLTIELDYTPLRVQIFRCDPAQISEVPDADPEEGVYWNRTNTGNVGIYEGFVYVDLVVE